MAGGEERGREGEGKEGGREDGGEGVCVCVCVRVRSEVGGTSGVSVEVG